MIEEWKGRAQEDGIRENITGTDFVDCVRALPAQPFYPTKIPAFLWLTAGKKKDRHGVGRRRPRERQGKLLFVNIRKKGGGLMPFRAN